MWWRGGGGWCSQLGSEITSASSRLSLPRSLCSHLKWGRGGQWLEEPGFCEGNEETLEILEKVGGLGRSSWSDCGVTALSSCRVRRAPQDPRYR